MIEFTAVDSENIYSTLPLTDSGAPGHSCPHLFCLRYFTRQGNWSLQMATCGPNPSHQTHHGSSESDEYGLISRAEETQHLMRGTTCGRYCCHPVWLGNGQPFITVEGWSLARLLLLATIWAGKWRGSVPCCTDVVVACLHSSRAVPSEELVLTQTFPSPPLRLEGFGSVPSPLLCTPMNALLSNNAVRKHWETKLGRLAHTTNLIPFSACSKGW